MLRAISIDAELAQVLGPGSVVALHHHTTTLETVDGAIITLAASELSNGPHAVLIDQRPWPVSTRFIPNGSMGLRFTSGPALDWTDALRWTAADAAPTAPPTIDNAPALAAALQSTPLQAGLLPIVLGRAPLSPVQQALARHATPLIAALPDPTAARGLIGLGPGATPAGDDLLAGLLLTLHYAQQPQVTALREVARQAQTTRLGRSLLRWAADGLAREPTLILLRDLFSRPAPSAFSRLQTVLNYGATSGADLLAGILIGLRVVQSTKDSQDAATSAD